jgi:DNA-binding Lrp family transcriptional regulator
MALLASSMDSLDEHLLALLRQNSRQTIAQLAIELNLSRAQVYARLARLEEAQIVTGYTVRLGDAFTASRIRAHMMIKTLPRLHRDVEQRLSALPQVQAIHAISGAYDIIAMLESDNSNQLNDLIDDIGLLEGVENTTTSVILATKLER